MAKKKGEVVTYDDAGNRDREKPGAKFKYRNREEMLRALKNKSLAK